MHWNKKWGHPARFCGRAAESAHQMHFVRFFQTGLGRVSKCHVSEREKKALKKSVFRDFISCIRVRTQCDEDST